MKTKNIFKALALAMLMPAMLLTTACSNDDDVVNTENTNQKGYELPVTINVTRQGDDPATRATYNGTSKKLEFSTGDKLFVRGSYTDGGYPKVFAGTLNWVSEGTFSGTITTQAQWTGTADALLKAGSASATLLPNGYGNYGFLSITNEGEYSSASSNYANAFATSKTTAIEQFSYEKATSYSSGFALSPQNAILNFTITGLTASTEVAVAFSYSSTTVSKNVTTDGSNATFAVGVPHGTDLNNCTLTVGGNAITLVSSSKTLAAGKIYNITRSAAPAPSVPEGAIDGLFSVSSTKQVYFSQGNLQYQASTSIWRFAENQWDYVGDATNGNVYVGEVKSNNASISSSYTGWIDLFGWGTSGWDCGNTYYRPWDSNNGSSRNYGPNGQYNLTDSYANSDWGYYNAISNGGNQSHQWRTLTKDEWTYLCDTRTTGGTVFGTSQARYTQATINTDGTGVNGIILFPDGVDIASSEVTTAGTVNGASNWTTKCTTAQWTALEAKGCVFLPAAGYRNGTSVSSVNSYVCYWSSSYSSNGYYNAYYVRILSGTVSLQSYGERYKGSSVRLVHPVE